MSFPKQITEFWCPELGKWLYWRASMDEEMGVHYARMGFAASEVSHFRRWRVISALTGAVYYEINQLGEKPSRASENFAITMWLNRLSSWWTITRFHGSFWQAVREARRLHRLDVTGSDHVWRIVMESDRNKFYDVHFRPRMSLASGDWKMLGF
jgi:hypothetical protein